VNYRHKQESAITAAAAALVGKSSSSTCYQHWQSHGGNGGDGEGGVKGGCNGDIVRISCGGLGCRPDPSADLLI